MGIVERPCSGISKVSTPGGCLPTAATADDDGAGRSCGLWLTWAPASRPEAQPESMSLVLWPADTTRRMSRPPTTQLVLRRITPRLRVRRWRRRAAEEEVPEEVDRIRDLDPSQRFAFAALSHRGALPPRKRCSRMNMVFRDVHLAVDVCVAAPERAARICPAPPQVLESPRPPSTRRRTSPRPFRSAIPASEGPSLSSRTPTCRSRHRARRGSRLPPGKASRRCSPGPSCRRRPHPLRGCS